jgi:hypothetical protein
MDHHRGTSLGFRSMRTRDAPRSSYLPSITRVDSIRCIRPMPDQIPAAIPASPPCHHHHRPARPLACRPSPLMPSLLASLVTIGVPITGVPALGWSSRKNLELHRSFTGSDDLVGTLGSGNGRPPAPFIMGTRGCAGSRIFPGYRPRSGTINTHRDTGDARRSGRSAGRLDSIDYYR